MEIDTNPDIDENNYTFTVQNNIDPDEEVAISMNGLIAITKDDIADITDNVITVNDSLNLDFDESFVVLYDKI